MTGNRQGPRSKVLYFPEAANLAYVLELDDDLIIAGAGDAAAAPVLFDPDNPPAGVTVTGKPQRFEPRRVFIKSTNDGARKEIVCTRPTANLYAITRSQTVPAIDSDNSFVTTGRAGERLTF